MMDEKKVLSYLKKHPDFLNQYAEDLGIRLKESKIHAFSEVRLASYEQKMDAMAQNMFLMYENAQFNHQMVMRLMNLNIALLGCNTLNQVYQALSGCLKEDFNLPWFAIRLLLAPRKKINVPKVFLLDGKKADYAVLKKLKSPVCGTKCLHASMYEWLPENAQVESFLQLPLRVENKNMGILLIAHENADYFSEEQATDYVEMMAYSISACLARIMGELS